MNEKLKEKREWRKKRFILFLKYLKRNEQYKRFCDCMQRDRFSWQDNPKKFDGSDYYWVTFGDISSKPDNELEKMWERYWFSSCLSEATVEVYDLSSEIKKMKDYVTKQFMKAFDREPTVEEFVSWVEMEYSRRQSFFLEIARPTQMHNLTKAREEFDKIVRNKFDKKDESSYKHLDKLEIYLEAYILRYENKKKIRDVYKEIYRRLGEPLSYQEKERCAAEERLIYRYLKEAKMKIKDSINCTPESFPCPRKSMSK